MRLIDVEPCEKIGHAMVLYATEGGMLVQIRSCDMPTIDAVPVVRCPLCKYHMVYKEKDGDGSYLGCTRTWGLRGALAQDDFCSYGERKDGEG